MLQEFRVAIRMLAKSPAFVLIAVATLALAIGANTAVFSLVNALLLRPLRYHEPSRLALVVQHFHAQGLERIPISAPEFVDYQQRLGAFEKIGAFVTANFNLAGDERPERVAAALVTSGVFDSLGVSPVHGRTFDASECQAGHDDVVVISARLWKQRFGSSSDIVGHSISLDGRKCTVVGVMPENFDFPIQLFNAAEGSFAERADLWRPLVFTEQQLQSRGSRGLLVVARLKPGISFKVAQAEVEAVNSQMLKEHPGNYPGDHSFGGDVLPLQDLASSSVRSMLLILLAAVVLVLLIACANLGTMLLARAASRERELAIRIALGADRWSIARQMLTESVSLALCGGFAGVLFATWGIDLFKRIGGQTVPRLHEINIDIPVLVVTLVVTIGAGLIFGLVPALTTARPQLSEALKEGGRGSTEGRRRSIVRNTLVVSEVALALVLLTGAGLLVKSFSRLQHVDAGFNPNNVLSMEVSLPVLSYPKNNDLGQFAAELERRLAAIPGVQSAGLTAILPLSGVNSDSSFEIEGRVSRPNDPGPDEDYREATGSYFQAMQIPLLAGRLFTPADKAGAPPVVIVNEALVKKFWPNGDALGHRITFGNPNKNPTWSTIVGVVGNVHHVSLDVDPKPEIYTPLAQSAERTIIIVLRGERDLTSLAAAARREVQAIDPGVAIARVRSMLEVVGESVAARRLSVTLLSVFALAAMLLASVGIYGVISFLVVQRTHEMGVRMALGAQRADVLALVLSRAAKLVGIGTAIGLLLAIFGTRTLGALLYQVNAFDAATFLIVTAILTVVALSASYFPALRATRADPMIALSHNA